MKYPYYRFTKWVWRRDLCHLYAWLNHFEAKGVPAALIKSKVHTNGAYAVWVLGEECVEERKPNAEYIGDDYEIIHETGKFSKQIKDLDTHEEEA